MSADGEWHLEFDKREEGGNDCEIAKAEDNQK
jgi:hypothetical protein